MEQKKMLTVQLNLRKTYTSLLADGAGNGHWHKYVNLYTCTHTMYIYILGLVPL